MAKRGPKPRSDAEKVLAGTRPDRIPTPQPPASAPPECPDWIAEDAVALAEWGRYVPLLSRRVALDEFDAPHLAVYCDAHSRLMKARRALKAGVTSTTDEGSDKAHPAVGVAERASAVMVKIHAYFLARPPLGKSAEVDPLAMFLAKG